jgi:class 3 adenylate cyclase
MRLREGDTLQRCLFVVLVGVYLFGAASSLYLTDLRVGRPDVGWLVDDGNISPTRPEVSEAGLRGGGRPLEINGEPYELPRVGPTEWPPSLRTAIGDTNVLKFLRPTGEIGEMEIPVRAWTWHDAIFSEGATFVLGLLFFAVGTITFVLRPYTHRSWALLSMCAVTGGILSAQMAPSASAHDLSILYFLTLVGFASATPLHNALAFPVTHPLLLRFPNILWLVYGYGAVLAAMYVVAWRRGFHGPFAFSRVLGAVLLSLSIALFIGRCVQLSLDKDSLVRQRAQILLAGSLLGLAPVAVVQVLQQGFQVFPIDSRFTYWTLGIFLFALGRVTLREDMMNAQIAVRRAVLYAIAVGVLTAAAWALTLFSPYAVAGLLLPLLYVWPRFVERLNRVLYPKRARFPEILRSIGDDMADSASVDAVLDKLADAPARLCDTTRSVAFILPGEHHPDEHVRIDDRSNLKPGVPLEREALVQIMVATRKTISRHQIAVEPHFSEIQDECYSGFDRLGADVLIPIVRHDRAIGGLAIGPRAAGDLYEQPELDALSTVVQQAVQSIIRVEATERLRARELEFADLKRFFSPQIIDQVMARGGASELRSTRKVVTVFFADLRGFTSFSDAVEPEEVMSTLAEYHEAMGARVAEYAGTLERFAGDGFMVFFNDPLEQQDHVARAARMALCMLEDVERLRSGWTRKGYEMHIGMGIHTGYATCGFVGYEGRRDYGVIGNVTNLAARLSDAAGPGEILVSQKIRAELGSDYQTAPVGHLELKGFAQPQEVFRLLHDGNGPPPATSPK